MAFSTQVRREAARVPAEKKCCARAELAAAVLCSGGLSFKGMGRYGLAIYADSSQTAQRYIQLLRRFYHCQAALGAVETTRLGGRVRYGVLPPEGDIPGLLKALRLLDPAQPFGLRSTPARDVVQEPCCRQAFLRGAYLTGGSTGNPQRAYHMELAVSEPQLAQFLCQLLEELGVPAKVATRKTQQVVYIKDGDHMAQMLTLLGAHRALLEFENLRIYKDIRNEANRQANCDSANVDKVVAAAQRQISMIQVIERKMGLDQLPPSLEEIARLRLAYPDASLSDLGGMVTPALGKSGVSARMRRLEEIAQSLVSQ